MIADCRAFGPGCTGCSIFIATSINELDPLTLQDPLKTNPKAPRPRRRPLFILPGRIKYRSPKSRKI